MNPNNLPSVAVSILVAVSGICFGCGVSSADRRAPLPPTSDNSQLTPVERLGYDIFQHDRVAWVATDHALATGLRADPVQGWLSFPTESGWLVSFIGPCGPDPCSFGDFSVKADGTQPTLSKPSPPRPLSDEEAAAWRARQLAIASNFRMCTRKYNPVVLPATHEGRPVWRVYLLAASDNPEEIILAGHHRIMVSTDGNTILKAEALSKSCLFEKRYPDMVGLFVTHMLDQEPIETHVFTNLNYGTPLIVATERANFELRGGRIRFIEKR